MKHNGRERTQLDISSIKQIAGRAGRYRTALQTQDHVERDLPDTYLDIVPPKSTPPTSPVTTIGLVTCLQQVHLPVIQQAMKADAKPLTSAGIFPPDPLVLRFATYFPANTPFSYLAPIA